MEAAAFLRIGHHPQDVVKMLGVGQSLSAPATAETADDITTLLTELAPLGSLDALLEAEGVRATLTPQTALEILQQWRVVRRTSPPVALRTPTSRCAISSSSNSRKERGRRSCRGRRWGRLGPSLGTAFSSGQTERPCRRRLDPSQGRP